jgi:signal transduction histidine kinase
VDSNQLNFKISSALKSLIGKELITDQYIAIFELVKNGFDAHATEVTVDFENIYDSNNTKIVIRDNGKGMDYDDIVNKWLFVAYSAKSDGTEDDDAGQGSENVDDYRNKITTKRIFAGAKGVGRFSCDRLGRKLNLITIKDSPNARIENINVSWDDFERDSKNEFMNIPVIHKVLPQSVSKISNGTILEISELREIWDRDTILRLKKSLEKLINPNQENDSDNFSIRIVANEEVAQDSLEQEERNKVNGIIKNSIFEKLNLKTTQIVAEISEDGETIITTLKDRGKLIYKLIEKNPYKIYDIKIHLFQLNFAAKLNFKKIMGMESVKYGSIFVYKNGFRVYPYGEAGEDFLSIDKRKAQGFSRFLGTRDLIGRIEINGNNESLKESTSRDGGLIKNKSYDELVKFYYEKVLKRLEKYVVDIIKWGDPYGDNDGNDKKPALNPEDVKSEILKIVNNLTRANEIISVEYDKDFLEVIDSVQERSVNNILKNLAKRAENINDKEMRRQVENATKEFKDLLIAKNVYQKDVETKQEELEFVNTELEKRTSQNLFLKSLTSHEINNVTNLFHQTGICANTIENYLVLYSNMLDEGEKISTKEIKEFIQKVSFENAKIRQISNYVTKANLIVETQEKEADLIDFIKQYVENIKKFYENDLKVVLNNHTSGEFIISFRPLEFAIIIDNLINNSKKANAKVFEITIISMSNNMLVMKFKDDGIGLHRSIKDPVSIFEMGITTTLGSGLGLYHVSELLKKLKGRISINTNVEKGIEFLVEVVR